MKKKEREREESSKWDSKHEINKECKRQGIMDKLKPFLKENFL